MMSTRDTLLAFSEWLDEQGAYDPDRAFNGDDRSHDDLANEFIGHWESDPTRATLAGRQPWKKS